MYCAVRTIDVVGGGGREERERFVDIGASPPRRVLRVFFCGVLSLLCNFFDGDVRDNTRIMLNTRIGRLPSHVW